MIRSSSLLLLSLASTFAIVAGSLGGGSSSVWPAAAYAKANATLSQLTLEEKVQLASGQNLNYQKCSSKTCTYVGWIQGIPRLNLSDVYLEDGPQGVADGMKSVTAWPSVMTVSMAWDPSLMATWGAAMGAEQVLKGSNVMLGPAVALVRVPWSGRNFEYMSEDPFLNTALAGPMVQGIQGNNISACVKHFILNSQETNRSIMSSNAGERTVRELYAPPYQAAVDAGVGSVMCSFNRINDTYSCAQPVSLNGWLKGEFGFDGFVVSDWGAQHGTIDYAVGGLDMEQEWVRNSTWYGPLLLESVQNGSVPLARLDDMARRVLLPMYALGYSAPGTPAHNGNTTANSTEHNALAADLARASLVLLKNEGGILPLAPAAGATILVLGDDLVVAGGGSGSVIPSYVVSAQAGIQTALPSAVVSYYNAINVTLAAEMAQAADYVILAVSVYSGEGSDRANLSLGCPPYAGPASCRYWPDQDALVTQIAAVAQGKLVLVVRTPGAIVMPWIDQVPAIIYQLFPGQEGGTALGEALSGALNPSGKLTISFPASINDTWLSPPGGGPIIPESYPGTDRGNGYPVVDYTEGLFVGYRWYDAQGTKPLFPFGHGLSYSSFTYSNLQVLGGPLSPTSNPAVNVTFDITNSAGPQGKEIAQLYVQGLPGDPPRALKGFATTSLAPAGAATLSIPLSLADLSSWSVVAHAWVPFPAGSYTVWVGASSGDIRLMGSVAISAI